MAWGGGPGILAAPAQGSAGQKFFNTCLSARTCHTLSSMSTAGSWIQPQDLASLLAMSGKKKKKSQASVSSDSWVLGDLCPWRLRANYLPLG